MGTISHAELPLVSPVPTLTDEATLDAALEHVLATIPLGGDSVVESPAHLLPHASCDSRQTRWCPWQRARASQLSNAV
jgi:hypothetical protein